MDKRAEKSFSVWQNFLITKLFFKTCCKCGSPFFGELSSLEIALVDVMPLLDGLAVDLSVLSGCGSGSDDSLGILSGDLK